MQLFDLHADTLTQCYKNGWSFDINPLHIDLTRGAYLSPWCQVFAVFVPQNMSGITAFEYAVDVLEYIHAQFAALKTCRCKILLSLENAAALAGKTENLKTFYDADVRIITLTWNGEDELGYGCMCEEKQGLKPFGKQVLDEMGRYGMVADVSHLNEKGFWDVLSQPNTRCIASHSLCKAVHSHPRNLTDEQIQALIERNSLLGLSFCTDHLGGNKVEDIYRHADYILSMGGENILALGADMDGTELPGEWGGIAFYETLYEFLSKKGWKTALLEQIFYQNAANFFSVTLQADENNL